MKASGLILFSTLISLNFTFAQTTLTVDANGVLNSTKIITQTSFGQSFFTGHQLGSGYSYPTGIFRAITDNPNGQYNYFFDGVAGSSTNFSVRADGQGYFAGYVGIGTNTPATRLHIVGNGASIDGGGNSFPMTGDSFAIQANTGGRSATTGAQLEFVIPAGVGGGNPWGQAHIITVAGNSTDNNATGEMILGTRRYFNKLGNGIQWYYGNDLTIDGNGYIGINTTNTKGYQLAVNGSAIATSMTVKLQTNWPDYVFKSDYTLPTLSEVKTYIDQNHRLPEIPSEEEVLKNGINLGEMNKLLIKKVEELTLYLIEKDKEIKEEKQANTQITELLKSQQSEIEHLKQQLSTLLKNNTK